METAARSGAALPLHSTWVRRSTIGPEEPVDSGGSSRMRPRTTRSRRTWTWRPRLAARPRRWGWRTGTQTRAAITTTPATRNPGAKSRRGSGRNGTAPATATGRDRRNGRRRAKERSGRRRRSREGTGRGARRARRAGGRRRRRATIRIRRPDGGDRKRISAVSGKKIKPKLEGTSARTDAEDKRRQAYLRSLNAHVDMSHLTGR